MQKSWQVVAQPSATSSCSTLTVHNRQLIRRVLHERVSGVLNVGATLKLPPRKDTLAERILDEADVHTLLAREPDRRNRVLLRLLYRAGLRVSEVAGLCWRDAHARDDGGQVTVFGKRGKTRTVLLPADIWRDLASLRGDAGLDAPVFRSRRGRHLDPS